MVSGILDRNETTIIGLTEQVDGALTLAGYASCWPVDRQVHAALRRGEGVEDGLSERNFQPEHVLGPADLLQTHALFIPGLAVRGNGTFSGKLRTIALCHFLLTHIRDHYARRIERGPLPLFFVGFTPQGRSFAAKLADPAGLLTLHDESCPFYEISIENPTLVQIELRLLKALNRAGSAAPTRDGPALPPGSSA